VATQADAEAEAFVADVFDARRNAAGALSSLGDRTGRNADISQFHIENLSLIVFCEGDRWIPTWNDEVVCEGDRNSQCDF
jgi:hypothetical protein